MLEVRLKYRPWVFGTLIYAALELERWGRLVWIGPSYTMTADKQHREFTVDVFICKQVTETPLFCVPYNAGFPFSLYLHHQNNRLENISVYYLPLFNPVAKNLFLGRKKYWRDICPPCSLRSAPKVTQVIGREAPAMFPRIASSCSTWHRIFSHIISI